VKPEMESFPISSSAEMGLRRESEASSGKGLVGRDLSEENPEMVPETIQKVPEKFRARSVPAPERVNRRESHRPILERSSDSENQSGRTYFRSESWIRQSDS